MTDTKGSSDSMFGSLPEPVQAGIAGAVLGAGAAFLMSEQSSLMSYAIGYAGVSAAGAYAGPMISADPMMQIAAASGVGLLGSMMLPEYVPGGMLSASIVPGAALYSARSFM